MKRKVFALLLCLVTLFGLFPVPANAAKTKLKITKQPQNCYVQQGEQIVITVSAQGDGLKYQWYFKNSGSSKYQKSSITTNTYTCAMTKERSGRQLYCVIKDKYGNSVKTNTVTCKIPVYAQITKQPVSTRVSMGSTAQVSLTAKGDGLKYQWYYRNAGEKTFSKSSTTSATYSVKMDSTRAGRYLYCVVTDKYGNTVKSDTVRILTKSSSNPASIVLL